MRNFSILALYFPVNLLNDKIPADYNMDNDLPVAYAKVFATSIPNPS